MGHEALFKYEKIAEVLRSKIRDGEISGKLLPELQLAKEFSVTRGTLRDALRLLQQEGLITRVQGSGTRVVSPVLSIREREQVGPQDQPKAEEMIIGRGEPEVSPEKHLTTLAIYLRHQMKFVTQLYDSDPSPENFVTMYRAHVRGVTFVTMTDPLVHLEEGGVEERLVGNESLIYTMIQDVFRPELDAIEAIKGMTKPASAQDIVL